MQQHFEIAGTGSALPSQVVTADEVDRLGGLKPGWTAKRSGVLTRYYCKSPESIQTMAVDAIEKAMIAAEVEWSEIDLIIDASTSRYRPIPGNAIHLQAAFGKSASGIPCMDVHSTCLGFILAINTANALFAIHAYRNILLVASEQTSISVNWNEPDSAVLLGDGAAAVVLRLSEPRFSESRGPASFAHATHAEYLDSCFIQGGGHLLPADTYTKDVDQLFRFHMDGPVIMRAAARHLPGMFETLLLESDTSREQLIVVPHQASPRAMKIMRRLLKMSPDRFLTAVQEIGNIASAGIPLMLDRAVRDSTIKSGDRVMLLGTSAGYSQAGLLFQF